MGREGPCFHCGVRHTPLWRPGPPEKPVLCNACGSRWRIKGSLNDYIPKHANKETQSFLLAKLPSDVKPLVLAHDNQRLEVGQKVAGTDGSSACSEEEIDDISSSGSPGSLSENCMQMQGTNGEAAKGPLWYPNSVPKRKRSKLKQYILSPVERLHRQLYHMLQEPEFANTFANEEEILIYQKSKSIPPDEIGNGAMLLISPSTAIEDSKPQFTTAENNGSCSSDFRNENSSLINNYILDHVAIQNGSSSKIGGKSRVQENKVSLHHTGTRVRLRDREGDQASLQCTLQSVKRPRGRSCVSTAQGTLQSVKMPRGRPRGSTA